MFCALEEKHVIKALTLFQITQNALHLALPARHILCSDSGEESHLERVAGITTSPQWMTNEMIKLWQVGLGGQFANVGKDNYFSFGSSQMYVFAHIS